MDLEGNTWGVYLQCCGQRTGVDHTTIVGPNGIGGPPFPGSPAGGVNLSHSRIRVTSPDGYNVLSALSPSSIGSSRLEGGVVSGGINGFIAIGNSRLTGVRMGCSDSYLGVQNTYVIGGGIGPGAACTYSLVDDHFIGPGSGVAASLGGAPYQTTVTGTSFIGWDTAITLADGSATITGNTFRHNGTGVASCTTSFCGGTISGNAFLANDGAGLVLTSGTWHVGSNLAARNGGLGIDAQGSTLTVIDDGGNVARRNLSPQCVGVACTVRP